MASVYRQPCDEGLIRARPADAPCARRQQKWVLAATILGSSLAFIDASSTNVALPALQASLGATVIEVQWVINAYTLMLAALILPGGALGDRLGRVRVFASGVAIFALASLWCGLAPTVGHLIAARTLQGVGGALLIPGSLTLISASFPADARGRAIGLWSGFSALTGAVGPVLGGWLIDTLSWRWIFLANVPVAVVILAIAATRLPESRDREAHRLDWRGALLITASLTGITYGLLESPTSGFAAPAVLAALLVGTGLFGAFVVVQARTEAPMVPLDLFRSPTFAGANLLTLLLYGALGGALFLLPLNLVQIQGYSATAAGAALLPFVLILFVLSRWAGGLVERYNVRLPLTVGPSIAAIGFALLALPGARGSYWLTIFPAATALGLGMATVVGPLTTTVMNAVDQDHAGTASGINNAVSRVATLLAISVLGIVMLSSFGSALEAQMARLDLPAEAVAAIRDRRASLAGMSLPQGLDDAQRDALRAAIADAFIVGYRAVMAIAAGIALASAGIGWLMIRPTSHGRT
jgi:EmrB/QacA subfamily drug resistance transporter